MVISKEIRIPCKIENPTLLLALLISFFALAADIAGTKAVAKAILNDIGTEELAHLEMIGSIVHQLTDGVPVEELEKAGLGAYYTDHGVDVYPQSAAGVPFTAAYIACKGDPVANLQEDLAAEQKARATYEKLIDLCADDPDVIDPLRFLREREVVHFQRFGEALNGVQEKLAQKCFYSNLAQDNDVH